MGAIELYARPSKDFAQKLDTTRALLKAAVAEFPSAAGSTHPLVTQASSLGAEDMVLTHILQELQLDVDIFVLETGALHAQTLELLERLKATSRLPVRVFHPQNEAVVHFVGREGNDAMYRSIALRKACCGIRKMEPLERALAGRSAWLTGLRREQSGARADVPLRDDSDPRRVKFNPLADWAWKDIWRYIADNGVDYNPLHDQFFPSIGCEPCTRAIALGEDFRSGRWWWEDESAKECGLHAKEQKNPEETAA